jgi:hypothetical protein
MATNTLLGPEDEEIGGVYHECRPTPNGMLMRYTFCLPAKTPKSLLEAIGEHSKTEMGNFPKFLPSCIRKDYPPKKNSTLRSI